MVPNDLKKYQTMSTIILGGGLTGLSAAYYFRKCFPNNSLSLFEASNRLGGWVKSNSLANNIIFEEGPRTIRPIGPSAHNTLMLIEELGLIKDVMPLSSQHPASKNRMIFVDGTLHTLPNSFSSLFRKQTPFSKPLIWYLLHDIFVKKKTVKDESIHDFAKRRFGAEVADYLISSLICGICAGNSKEISVNFLMKDLFEYEQKYGSVSKGLVNNFLSKRKDLKSKQTETSELVKRVQTEKWSAYSLRNGLETLPKALETYIRSNNVSIELNSECKSLEIYPDQNVMMQLECGKNISSSYVINSLPAQKCGNLIQKQHPELAEMLYKIQSVTVGVVNLHFDKKIISKEAFGFLIPPKEKLPILGVTFDSCCFPKGDNTVLTVMMGGPWFEEYFGKSPDKNVLLKTAREQLLSILNITEEPIQYKVNILENCIPQYKVGHYENIDKIKKYIQNNNLPIFLCGASYEGVSVNDVILSGKNVVDKLLHS